MSIKTVFGTMAMAALLGWATQAAAVPQFQLRVVTGTYDQTFVGSATNTSGAVTATLNNINGGGGNLFKSGANGTLAIQGNYDYSSTPSGKDFYFSLTVPDIYHNSNTAGQIDFYLTMYDIQKPAGDPMPYTYDLTGTNAKVHVATSPDNTSTGHLYYSATNSHDPVGNPGTTLVATPAIASNFVTTPECHLSGPNSLSYSCAYVDATALVPLYSLTQQITLTYSASTSGFKARGQSSVDIPFSVPEPASMVLLGSGLLAAAGFARRKKAKQNA